MTGSVFKQHLEQAARRIGFSSVGVSAAKTLDPQYLHTWLDRGYHGEMSYLERATEKRLDPRAVFEGVKTIASLTVDYGPQTKADPLPSSGLWGRVSRYASGPDYHRVLGDMLKSLLAELKRVRPSLQGRIYTDTGPILEKVWAWKAGLGWIGKHTNLISKARGSWFFIGELLLDLDIEADQPAADHCGTCRRCIEACPTAAIVEPYVLDARRCISYLTIELRSAIPEQFRDQMGDWIFGCDVCQEVCPWNLSRSTAGHPELEGHRRRLDLVRMSRLSKQDYSAEFSGTAIKRARWNGFLRNVVLAMANLDGRRFLSDLKRLAGLDDELVSSHARWALQGIEGPPAKSDRT